MIRRHSSARKPPRHNPTAQTPLPHTCFTFRARHLATTPTHPLVEVTTAVMYEYCVLLASFFSMIIICKYRWRKVNRRRTMRWRLPDVYR